MTPKLHSTLDGLAAAVLANNHIAVFGLRDARDTQALLVSNNIIHVGYGASLNDALKLAFLDMDGGRLGIVSLCCPTTNSESLATHRTPGVAPLGMATLKKAVEGARKQCDALVVFLHWGCEWVHDPAPDQLRLARHAIDCGADAVVSCHSHTIQSYEQYKGRWIFYKLGNFLFNAGEAQRVHADGSIERIPIVLHPQNRESLVVSFRITPDTGAGRMTLDRIQPMRYGEDWMVRPIALSDLTFDVPAANRRLAQYAKRHEEALASREEPVFRATLLNGVLAYWHMDESIVHPPLWQRSYRHGRRFAGRLKRTLARSLGGRR